MRMKGLVPIVLSLMLLFGCFKTEESNQNAVPSGTVSSPATVRATSNPGAKVIILEPKNQATVSSPVTVKFGIEGAELAKAGEVKSNSGHHHLLIDVETLPSMDQPLPFSDTILHFGQAQTEASVNLTPGTHTLQLVLAGGNHIPLDPPVVSEKITIQVQ